MGNLKNRLTSEYLLNRLPDSLCDWPDELAGRWAPRGGSSCRPSWLVALETTGPNLPTL
jgi:hypothetical protein